MSPSGRSAGASCADSTCSPATSFPPSQQHGRAAARRHHRRRASAPVVAAPSSTSNGASLEGVDGRLMTLDELWTTGVRINEGGCDPDGRFSAGSMAYDKTPGAGGAPARPRRGRRAREPLRRRPRSAADLLEVPLVSGLRRGRTSVADGPGGQPATRRDAHVGIRGDRAGRRCRLHHGRMVGPRDATADDAASDTASVGRRRIVVTRRFRARLYVMSAVRPLASRLGKSRSAGDPPHSSGERPLARSHGRRAAPSRAGRERRGRHS